MEPHFAAILTEAQRNVIKRIEAEGHRIVEVWAGDTGYARRYVTVTVCDERSDRYRYMTWRYAEDGEALSPTAI